MKRKVLFLFVVLCLSLLQWNPSLGQPSAGVLYVKTSASGTGDCGLWVNACTLHTALENVNAGEEIWVAAGTHKPTIGADKTATFQLKNGVAVYGGFAGGEANLSERDWESNLTVLSGDIDNNDITDPNDVVTDTANISGTNSLHVVTGSGTNGTAVLDGFTITAGKAEGISDQGGGVFNVNGSPTLNHLKIIGNFATGGGGMRNDNSNPALYDVIFSGNYANFGCGGGMRNSNGSNPSLEDVIFSDNYSHAAQGGGLCNTNSSSTLVNVIFSGNESGPPGGGEGGGMYNNNSNATLTNVVFTGNYSGGTGGGLYNYQGNSTLTNVTFSGNSADDKGGGVYSSDSSPTLTNVILWGNTAAEGAQMHVHSGSPTIDYGLIQDGCPTGATCGGGIGYPITTDPQFMDADGLDNTYGTLDDDLRLKFTSPAIDKGSNAALPADVLDLDGDSDLVETLPYDLAGNPRISVVNVDLGPYELDCFGANMFIGDQFLAEGQKYRQGFHEELVGDATVKIGDIIGAYATIGMDNLEDAVDSYETALACATTATEKGQAVNGILNADWELATGAVLTGNDSVVDALDIVYDNPLDPLDEEIGQLQEAIDWYARGTDAYLELLATEYITTAMNLQPTRVNPLDDQVTPYLDWQRLALVIAKKSKAYLELAERQYRKYTTESMADAEETLRQGVSLATDELALLGNLWDDAADDISYDVIVSNISDMQRLFDHMLEGKNPFGFGPDFVPFHFDPDNLPDNNYEQTKTLADAELAAATTQVNNAVGKQGEVDDNYQVTQQRYNSIISEYNGQLTGYCGTDNGNPDIDNCYGNTGGEVYRQMLKVREANNRIQLVMQQMQNQNELVRIEQQRAAEVAGIQRGTAYMIDPDTSKRLTDLSSQQEQLAVWGTNYGFDLLDGCVEGMISMGNPLGCALGGIQVNLGKLRTGVFDAFFPSVDQRSPEEKMLDFQAWQQAQVMYAEAAITDAESEALIKQYFLRFAELDIEMSIAVNNLEQELARLDAMTTQVEYLMAEKDKAEAFTAALFQDPSGRVMRDYYMELANDRFEVALEYAYRAGRALEYEINWDPAFGAGPITEVDDLYNIRDIVTLDAALAQMDTAYNNFLARPDVPVPQLREDVIYLGQALGFEDAYDQSLGRVVTREEKFNAFVKDQANWVDLDGNGTPESLQFTFQTSIFLGNGFFATSVFNDKIVSVQMKVKGTGLGDDRAVIHLEQSGTSFIRTLNAFSSQDAHGRPVDDMRDYNVAPLKASIMAATNDNVLPPGVAVNLELATRSVAFTNWTLTLDQVNEPNNFDLDINGIDEIELIISHEASTLQTLRLGEGAPGGGADIFQPPSNRDYRPVAAHVEGLAVAPLLNQPLGQGGLTSVNADDLNGTFFGTIVISNPMSLPPLELTIVLTDTYGTISGYVDQTDSLDFPVVDETSGRGPALTGSRTGLNFDLQSEVYASSSMTITQRISLDNGVMTDGGDTLKGDFTATLWGFAPYPLNVSGAFSLMRLEEVQLVPEDAYKIFLPLVMR